MNYRSQHTGRRCAGSVVFARRAGIHDSEQMIRVTVALLNGRQKRDYKLKKTLAAAFYSRRLYEPVHMLDEAAPDFLAISKASSSIGRAAVSKTAGWGFDSLLACQ